MYDPRYSPVYQIPYQPLYETTRHEIQHGLLSLQQKLRRRRQIDREIAAPLVPYPSSLQYLQQYNDNLRRLQPPTYLYNNLDQEHLYRLKAATQLNNLNRIEKLRMERDFLAQQSYHQKKAQKNVPQQRLSFDDDQLIKKYQNGSVAKMYYEDLQNQRHRIQSEQLKKKNSQKKQENFNHHKYEQTYDQIVQNSPYQKYIEANSPNKKQIKKNINHRSVSHFQSQKKEYLPLNSNLKNSIYQTPYDKFKQQPSQNGLERKGSNLKEQNIRNQIKNQLHKKFAKIDQVQQNFKDQQIQKKETQTFRFNKPPQNISKISQKDASPYKKLNKYQSLGRIANNRSKSNFSPFKRSYLQDEYLQAKYNLNKIEVPKKSVKQIQLSGLKKIENRLKVSKVIYEDSQFRNIKYEGNHLYNTYEIEIKQRKQIRQKINNNPVVLRKHPLVVE